MVPVLSARANAVVKNLDFSEALKVPGVVGALTPKDIPNNKVQKCDNC